ncbi:MAG TPA: AbiH family protein [Bacteroidales bacterium]|nr:AbiH family protein [Bacteroidales bacterium]HPR59172.1 AbiH family protein [Bacteroidales bacterium]
MNKLLIIGNGFDLAHGLKTRYSDFLVWYLNQLVKKHYESNNLNKYEDELAIIKGVFKFTGTIKSIEDFKTLMGKNLGPSVEYKDDFLEKLIDICEHSQWVDIEREYFNLLKELVDYSIKDNGANLSYVISLVKKLNVQFDFLKEKLIEYLKTLKINSQLCNSSIAANLEMIIHEDDKDDGIAHHGDNVCILNFNYTNTLKIYNKEHSGVFPLNGINIHGSLNSHLGNIIFGYGDEMDPFYQSIENLNSNELLRNIKSFSYLKNGNYQKFRLFTDSAKFKVYILGHSCGLSDRILLNSIFEHVNCESIMIYYHKRSTTDNDYTEKTMEISRHFSPQHKDLMRRRIVPFDKCRPLT